MHRIYSRSLELGSTSLLIKDIDIIHQLGKVLRSQQGDLISFFNGDDVEYVYRIETVEKRSIMVVYESEKKKVDAYPRQITLFQSIPNKWEKMELIVQKCCEIGVSEVVFFPADRSQYRTVPEKKKIRLQKINIESTEQSGRSKPMTISYSENQTISKESVVLCLNGDETHELKTKLPTKNLSIHVGPEGGWSDEEGKFFSDNKTTKWKMGKSTLRTETAAICGSFYLMYF